MTIRCRDVDRLAASRLLARFGIEATPEAIEIASREFAAHRTATCDGLVERAHQKIVETLEKCSIEFLASRSTSEAWAEGFGFAEQTVAMLGPEDLIDELPDVELSKGQILRLMIRSARKSEGTSD